MLWAIVATCVLGTARGVSLQTSKKPWEIIGGGAACKGKQERDSCEYAPHGLEHNYLFSYSHDQQLKKSIKQVFEERGFDKDQWHNLLIIKSQAGKTLDLGFLHLPDIFDGGVTPNDFPVKVFLQETWKGNCGRVLDGRDDGGSGGGPKLWCIGVRSVLKDACDNQQDGDSCTYASLQNERSKIEKAVDFKFKGECQRSMHGQEWGYWCKLPSLKEQQIEACVGKLVGKSCQYSTNAPSAPGSYDNDNFHKGICTGGEGGWVLHCKGSNAALNDACEGKVRGDKCKVEGAKPWSGWCGYADTALQCMNGKHTGPSPAPEPEPEPEPKSLGKDLKAMRSTLDKIAAKLGVSSAPAPTPPPAFQPPSSKQPSRRRGGRRRRRKSA